MDGDGSLVLGDEALTPDSSRFWPADGVRARRSAAVLRQAVRARLVPRDRVGPTPPGPELPHDVVAGTRSRYVDAFERLTDVPFERLSRRPDGRAVQLTVLIRPKSGILDPQGEAVQASLARLGFAVTRARVGRLVDLELDADDAADARSTGREHVRRAACQPADRELRDRDGRRMTDDAPEIAVVTFPGSNDDGDACLALELLGAEAVPVWHTAGELPDRRRRRGPSRRLLVRRLPPLRRSRPRGARDGRRAAASPPTAGRCSGSATASRSSARPVCSPESSAPTGSSSSSARTSASPSSRTATPFTSRARPARSS